MEGGIASSVFWCKAKAKAYGVGGYAAAFQELQGGTMLTAILRWQNDQGRRMRQEFAVAWVRENGHVQTKPEAFADWLLAPAVNEAQTIPDREETKQWFEAEEQAADRRLGEISNVDLNPANRKWVSGGWCER